MSLITEQTLWFVPLCILLGVGYAFFLYRGSRERYEWSSPLVWLMAIARALLVTLLAFFLLGPMLRMTQRDMQKPVIVIAHDGSNSVVATADSMAMRTTYPEQLEALATRLGDKYEVRSFTYGEEVREGVDRGQADQRTDMSAALQEIYDRYSGANLGAVIIDGDGIYNSGRDPLYVAEKLKAPIFTIALGDTTVRKDLVLSDAEHNRITYLGNEFPVIVRYKAYHLSGTRSTLTVEQAGRVLQRKEVAINGDPTFGEVPILVKAEKSGVQRYTLRMSSVQGEVNTANNAVDIYVEVLDDRQRVLLIGQAPHPDLAAIGDAIAKNENYEVDRLLIKDVEALPKELDLVILHGLPDGRTTGDLLARIKNMRLPVWLILTGSTDLPEVARAGFGHQVKGANGRGSDAQARVDRGFTAFKIEPKEIAAIERFPPLQVPFGEHVGSPAAQVLLRQRIGVVATEYPLLSLLQQNEERIAVLAGEGIWRWRLYDHLQNGSYEITDKLIGKVVQYLALKADRKPFRVNAPRDVHENERLVFEAELYNDNYEPVNAPEVEMKIYDEGGSELLFAFSRTEQAYRADIGALPPGGYRYSAFTEFNGQRLKVDGQFSVRAMLLERAELIADHHLMQALAERNGGSMVNPASMDQLVEQIGQRKDVVTKISSRAALNDLVDLKWLFAVLLVLLSFEWVTRRRNGAY